MNAVYISPDVDYLPNQENIDEKLLMNEESPDTEIARTFEIEVEPLVKKKEAVSTLKR